MEAQHYDSTDSKYSHRIEMLMLAILVLSCRSSTSRPGPVSSRATTTSCSSSSPTSTSSAARTLSPSPSYLHSHSDLLPHHPAPSDGPDLLPLRDLQLDDHRGSQLRLERPQGSTRLLDLLLSHHHSPQGTFLAI